MERASKTGAVVRKRLADISNLQQTNKQSNQEGKHQQAISLATNEYIDKLPKENMTLVKALADRNKVIEMSGMELQKLRINLQKVQQHNLQLAQANSQMLAEFNSCKDRSYKGALANSDDSRVAKVEDFFKSIEEEKVKLESQVAKLSEELSGEKDRILRITADFDNFRNRNERDSLSLIENTQGEVVEKLLGVVDNFERAKMQIKVETEGEEKINNSCQSIYKQLIEIIGAIGVLPVETIGKPFDPCDNSIFFYLGYVMR